MPSSMTRPSTWWNIGLCVASYSSVRNTRPGADDVDRWLAGEHRPRLHRAVCVRSTRWCSAGSAQKVSCIVRAGWSGPRLSASKFSHSASTSGPSATSQPIATKTSAIRSDSIVIGCRAPFVERSQGRVTSTVSSTSIRCSASTSSSAWRCASAWFTAPRAWPTRWPASLRACGGSAPISRLARASGERSPACSVRTRLSASRSRGGGDRGEGLLAHRGARAPRRAGSPGPGRTRSWGPTSLPLVACTGRVRGPV